MRELRRAVRVFVRRPSVALVAVATLAIGIAASTVVFTLADAILWHPLPFKDPERVVALRAVQGHAQMRNVPLASIDAWQAKGEVLERVYTYGDRSVVVTAGEPHTMRAGLLSPGLLTALGAVPISGREFIAADAAPGAAPVAIVSSGLARELGLEIDSAGGTLTVDGARLEIVGVMPAAFAFPTSHVKVWLPLAEGTARHGRVIALARLRPGVTLARADAFAAASTHGLVGERGRPLAAIRLAPLVEADAGTVTALRVLLGAVALLFLIAVGNASNVLLAEAVRRDAEMALRASLGATRRQLARQVLAESLVLSGVAALVGAGAAVGITSRMAASVPFIMSFEALRSIEVDGRALAFSIGAAALAGVASGLASVLRGTRRDLHLSLQGAASPGRGHVRLREGFTVGQLAFTLALLTGAGLLGHGFLRAVRSDPGFEPAGVHAFSLDLPAHWFPDETTTRQRLEDLRETVASSPDVVSATISDGLPPPVGYMGAAGMEPSDGSPIGQTDDTIAFVDVDGAFFSTLRIPLLSGRTFDPRDVAGGPPTAVISRSLASRLWPGRSAVGRHFRLDAESTWLTVVGVAGDVPAGGLDQPRGTLAVYVARAQQPTLWHAQTLIVRARSESPAVLAAVRAHVRRMLPDAPINSVETAEDEIADASARIRFATGVMSAFAAVALALALIGVYGTFWYSVRQRTSEIGVRMALGATPAAIMKMILLASGRMVLVGALLGIPLALAGARALRSLLFDVSPYDPSTLVVVVLALAFAALAAAYLPARAATRIDPLAALRHQ